MFLTLTNSGDATADFLLSRFECVDIPFVRIDTDSVLDRVGFEYRTGSVLLHFCGQSYRPSDFQTVWYRRPERLKWGVVPDSPEGNWLLDEWSEALEAFLAHIPNQKWINHPTANSAASRKLEVLTTAQRFGLNVPDTLVTQDENAARQFFKTHNGAMIVKPLGRGYIDRNGIQPDSLIYANSVVNDDMQDLSDLANCPAYFQQRIDKAIDVRITMLDGFVHAVSLSAVDADGKQRCDIRRNNMRDVQYSPIDIPATIVEALRSLLQWYNLRFGAIDMVVSTSGDWYFLEVNPNGQWAWLDQVGATDIATSFVSVALSDVCSSQLSP